MADELTAEELAALARSPEEASGQAGMMKARSAKDILALDQAAADKAAGEQASPQGGKRGGWGMTRTARVVPPGAV